MAAFGRPRDPLGRPSVISAALRAARAPPAQPRRDPGLTEDVATWAREATFLGDRPPPSPGEPQPHFGLKSGIRRIFPGEALPQPGLRRPARLGPDARENPPRSGTAARHRGGQIPRVGGTQRPGGRRGRQRRRRLRDGGRWVNRGARGRGEPDSLLRTPEAAGRRPPAAPACFSAPPPQKGRGGISAGRGRGLPYKYRRQAAGSLIPRVLHVAVGVVELRGFEARFLFCVRACVCLNSRCCI